MIGDRIEVNIAGGLDIPLPRMVHVRQKFKTPKLDSVTRAVVEQFQRPEVRNKVKPGMTVAVGCGSRGINNIAECAKAVIGELKALGARPFIFPAMGSHGGATAEGQREVLESYGITESFVGCPIRSSMDVVELGKLEDGMPVYIDKHAAEADAIAVIARVKPHTNFRAPIESGIVKMLTIGMGKIAGATTLHTYGMDMFGELLPRTARFIMSRKNVLFGVAMVENAADETALIEIVPGEQVLEREPALLAKAKELMPRLQFDEIDVLVVERIGKNISGSGMDPNITGRNCRFIQWEMKPYVKKIVVLGLTPETHGNATGLGAADVITMRLYREMDIAKTYTNIITSTYLDGGAIPMIMNTDEEAIKLAAKTVVRMKPQDTKIVRIANTLEIVDIQVSEPLLKYVKANPSLFEIVGEPEPFKFDARGNLYPMLARAQQPAHA
ncbi:MAG TPA: lactate racemase domain-containing protein [Burkholderiales bacterium]|nr:lactate racemase domain-containing protein [Burkholderiales bacterium]